MTAARELPDELRTAREDAAPWLAEIELTRTTNQGERLSASLAREIERQIVSRQLPEGELIGSEAAILEVLGVSRAVYREAVRLLEHHGIAEVRMGPRGGLTVTRPSLDAVTRSVAILLELDGVDTAELYDARITLELRALELATERMSEAAIGTLRAAVSDADAAATEDERVDRGHEFHRLVAQLSGSSVLNVFIQTLTELTDARLPRRRSRESHTTEAFREHAEIAEAMVAGDVAVARHRMKRHLEKNLRILDHRQRERSD